ncbi:DUF2271 domain-containing protein [Verrucomicrobiaceae bacterium 5K15]|uniref:DUF2271 domain-containing protein n=1 Tax=Oceaniferula flava TaxID=2800421 RepID=A0AAE2SCK9_9BACT|nr:DUF2271 domain-containing protein [Oceaniferula flavus]MBK1854902.1 DUF2271 domain-containing protein [Oceaniferula flavus]MBM1136208.1 DUF2271 domain-containing protein [Oceaniferula flavus]
MKKSTLLLLGGATAVHAQGYQLEVEIPRLKVSEYHRPYVAAWIENADRSHVANLTVCYDTEMKNDEGEKWLKDLRQWWRRSGRELDMPVDGVSGPTRPPGKHKFAITEALAKLPPLAGGKYTLVVEASREVGGRELVKIPFSWDGKKLSAEKATGKSELGEVSVTPIEAKSK